MDHAIPSDVTVIDIDGDGFADRMYVGDMAAQLFRFDITNGNPRSTLVTGGVVASLGDHDMTATAVDARRFYNAPDVAAVQKRGLAPYMNVAIGSGYRGHPLNTQIQDRFYAFRDFLPFGKRLQSYYTNAIVAHESDMVDITLTVAPTIPAGAAGWLLKLNQPGGTWVGEKSLSMASTVSNQVLFTTYTPNSGAFADPCQPGIGTNKIYSVSVFDGSPINNLNSQTDGTDANGNSNLTIADRSQALAQGGIAPAVAFLFPPNQPNPSCMSGCRDAQCLPQLQQSHQDLLE